MPTPALYAQSGPDMPHIILRVPSSNGTPCRWSSQMGTADTFAPVSSSPTAWVPCMPGPGTLPTGLTRIGRAGSLTDASLMPPCDGTDT